MNGWSKIPRKVWIPAIVIAALAVYGKVTGYTSQPSQPQPAVQAAPVAPKCTLSSGMLWAGVKLYSDAGCQNTIGTVLGGSKVNGEKTVRIAFANGVVEDKLRKSVTQQAYMMTNDPAMSSQGWREF